MKRAELKLTVSSELPVLIEMKRYCKSIDLCKILSNFKKWEK